MSYSISLKSVYHAYSRLPKDVCLHSSTLYKPQSGTNLTKISSGKNLLPYPTRCRAEKPSESLQRHRRPWGPVRTHPPLVCLPPSSQPHRLLAGAHDSSPLLPQSFAFLSCCPGGSSPTDTLGFPSSSSKCWHRNGPLPQETQWSSLSVTTPCLHLPSPSRFLTV